MAIDIVADLSRVKIDAYKYSFQENKNIIAPIAIIADPAIGKTILMSTFIVDAPSIKAASSVSFGISSKKPFNSQILKGKLNTKCDSIIAKRVSISPNILKSKKNGITVTMGGNILKLSIHNKILLLPGIRILENPYDAILPKKMEMKVTVREIIKLLSIKRKFLNAKI
jgi:hypothetical protein